MVIRSNTVALNFLLLGDVGIFCQNIDIILVLSQNVRLTICASYKVF